MNPEVFRAASTGNLSFFEKDCNSNLLEVTRTPEENTVLHVALQFNQFEVAKKIVSLHRSLVLKKNSKGNTPLHVASRAGTSSIVKLLIDEAKKVDVEVGGQQQLLSMVNQDSDTALHVAVRYGNFEVVKELINENDPAELAKKVNNYMGNPHCSSLWIDNTMTSLFISREMLQTAPMLEGTARMSCMHLPFTKVVVSAARICS